MSMILFSTPPTTPENLIVERETREDESLLMREVGRDGCVIYEYTVTGGQYETGDFWYSESDGLPFLLSCLEKLEKRYQQMRSAKAVDANEMRTVKWNRKAASRRLRRYIDERQLSHVVVPPRLLEVVARIRDESPAPDDEIDTDEVLEETFFMGRDYLRRRRERPVIILGRKLDQGLKELFERAQRNVLPWSVPRHGCALPCRPRRPASQGRQCAERSLCCPHPR